MVETKTFVDFCLPGLFFPEHLKAQVNSKDVENLEIPDAAFAFRFFDIVESEVQANGKCVKTSSDPTNASPTYYIGTKIYSKKEFEEETNRDKNELPAHAVVNRQGMLARMKDSDLVIKVRGEAGFMQIEKGDCVLLLDGRRREVRKI